MVEFHYCVSFLQILDLTTCLVIFILLVTFNYLRYKHREDRRQRYREESGLAGDRRPQELGAMPAHCRI